MIVNKDGRVVSYMGDDERFDYVYRFVTEGTFEPANRAANRDLLDKGTLSVARFNEDGSMEWLPLVHGQGPLTAENGFASGRVLINARLASDALGATKMDRPEDIEPNPKTGKVYVMLTNNDKRKAEQDEAANPRAENKFGHIVEMTPPDGDHAANKFAWEILVKCGDPAIAEVGATFSPATTKDGWFGMPDNCAIDAEGRLWIATDGNNPKATGRSDGIWAMETEGEMRGTRGVLPRPGGRGDVRPMLHARRQDPVPRRAASGRGGSPRARPAASTTRPPAGRISGRHAAAAVDRGHDQGGRRRDRRLIRSDLCSFGAAPAALPFCHRIVIEPT